MARAFRDADGVLWEVHESGAFGYGARHPDEPAPEPSVALLVFESKDGRRAVSEAPIGWREASEDWLREELSRAQRGRGDRDPSDVLAIGARIIRHDTALLRQAFIEQYEAADPTPGHKERTRIVEALEKASDLPEAELPAFLRECLSDEDVAEIAELARELRDSAPHRTGEDRAIRERYGWDLSELEVVIRDARSRAVEREPKRRSK